MIPSRYSQEATLSDCRSLLQELYGTEETTSQEADALHNTLCSSYWKQHLTGTTNLVHVPPEGLHPKPPVLRQAVTVEHVLAGSKSKRVQPGPVRRAAGGQASLPKVGPTGLPRPWGTQGAAQGVHSGLHVQEGQEGDEGRVGALGPGAPAARAAPPRWAPAYRRPRPTASACRPAGAPLEGRQPGGAAEVRRPPASLPRRLLGEGASWASLGKLESLATRRQVSSILTLGAPGGFRSALCLRQ